MTIGTDERLLELARAALDAMMSTWLDYHDAHSLTQPVTGASANAFDKALAARDAIDDELRARTASSTREAAS